MPMTANLTAEDSNAVARLIKGQEAIVTVTDDQKLTIKVHQGWVMVEMPLTPMHD